ncbi:MAG: NFACT family protein, partial [Defluviitoga tunisiensis]
MPFDGLVLYKVLREVKEHVIGERIRNIYQPVYYQVLLQLSNNYLLFSLQNPSYMLLLAEKPDIPMEPAHFAQFLRKRIRNGRILQVEQLGLDRLGFIEIESYDDERSEKVIYKLYFELMGRNSNLILVNEEGKIEEAYKHVHDDFRPILPGAKFIPYYDDSKLNILRDNVSILDDSFLNNLMGFSKKSKDFLKIIGVEKAIQDLNDSHLYFFKDNNKFDAVAITPNNYSYEKLTPSEAILKVFQERANQSRF